MFFCFVFHRFRRGLFGALFAFFRRIVNERRSVGGTSGSQIPNYIWWLAHSSSIEWTSKDPLIAGQTLTFRIKVKEGNLSV